MEERSGLFLPPDASAATRLVNRKNIWSRLRRVKRSRSPGVDCFTIEHLAYCWKERLNSVLLGGNRNAQLPTFTKLQV